MLDDGRLTDSQGRTVDFRNTIIIMTSNLGAKRLHEDSAAMGFLAGKNETDTARVAETDRKEMLAEVKRFFRPEFINRLDEIIVFHPLTTDDLQEIVDRLVDRLNRTLRAGDLAVTLTPKAKEVLIREGSDTQYGARPLKRALRSLVEDPISEHILAGDLQKGHVIAVDADEQGKLTFTQQEETVTDDMTATDND